MMSSKSKSSREVRKNASETEKVRKVKVADLFAGAGGSSTGAKKAIRDAGAEMELVAVNHWSVAIQTHQINHPGARHYIQDIEHADPEAIVPDGYLDILMASPECKYHSRARGGKPINDQGRMNPWAIMDWLTKLDVNMVLVENVPEWLHWGPIDENKRPIKKHRGQHFETWFMALIGLGYQAEWRKLNSADYGDATSRTRFFLIARKDGKPIQWPEPTHAKRQTAMFPGLKPWRPAREIIDWSQPGRSILDDPKYQKKPLSAKTRQRIAKGLEKFGGPLAPFYIQLLDLDQEPNSAPAPHPDQPFILNRHGENGSDRIHSIDEPFNTITCRGAGYLTQTTIQSFIDTNRNENVPKDIDEPAPCITTANGGGNYIVEPDAQPYIIPNFGERESQDPRTRDIEEPLYVITSRGAGNLVEPEARPFMLGQQSGYIPRDADQTVPTVSAAGAISLIRPTIIQYYGWSHAQNDAAPLSTITQCNKHALVEYVINSVSPRQPEPQPENANAAIIDIAHGNGHQGDRGNDRRVHAADDPLGAITTIHGMGISVPMLIQTGQTGGNGMYARPVHRPAPTITTQNDINLAEPCAEPYLLDKTRPDVNHTEAIQTSQETAKQILDHAIQTGIDPRRIILIDTQPYILDIRFRMLLNEELARATGFDDEESVYTFAGNKTQITKQIGNAVPVNMAAALVRAMIS